MAIYSDVLSNITAGSGCQCDWLRQVHVVVVGNLLPIETQFLTQAR